MSDIRAGRRHRRPLGCPAPRRPRGGEHGRHRFVPELFQTTAGRGYSYFMLGADARTIGPPPTMPHGRFRAGGGGPAPRLSGRRARRSARLAEINTARPDVLLVGMGNPIQEQWIRQWLPRLDVGLCLGIGGLFDYWAGNVGRRAMAAAAGPRVDVATPATAASEGQPLSRRQSAVHRSGAARPPCRKALESLSSGQESE